MLRKFRFSTDMMLQFNEGNDNRKSLVIMVMILLICAAAPAIGESAADYSRLRRDLLKHYDTATRPRMNQDENVTISINITPYQLHDLHEQQQLISTLAHVTMRWRDEFLRWDPKAYGNLTSINLVQSDVWEPRFFVVNSANGYEWLSSDSASKPIDVLSDGTIFSLIAQKYDTRCTLDIRFFPFDTQTCNITIMSPLQIVKVDALILPTLKTAQQDHGEWEWLQPSMTRSEICDVQDGSPRCYVRIDTTIHLKRRPKFFILNLILPVIFLSFLHIVVFVLPHDSGEKMTVSTAVLIANTVLMMIFTSVIPASSLTTSYLGVYMVFVLTLGTSSVVMSAISLRIYHQESAALSLKTPACCIHGDSEPTSAKGEQKKTNGRDIAKLCDNLCLGAFIAICILSSVVLLALIQHAH